MAGSILAWNLLKENKSVAIISDSKLPTSSGVAGGLINPITGKYLAKTWMLEELFPELENFYANLESELGLSFYHKTGLLRPFSGTEHQKSSLKQVEKHALGEYLVEQSSDGLDSFFNSAEMGGLFSKDAGWIDIPVMLNAMHNSLKTKAVWLDDTFQFGDLVLGKFGIEYQGIEAKRLIFCEGFYARKNPYFSWLPFNPVKGETLVGKIENYDIPSIINQGKWLIPLGGSRVRLGATYAWHSLDFEPSEQGKEELMKAARKMLKVDFEPEKQQAGVRPATKDRRPFLGVHPEFRQLFIFNGLGTKGLSLAPFFAKQMVAYLEKNQVILPEVNIQRFYTLYS